MSNGLTPYSVEKTMENILEDSGTCLPAELPIQTGVDMSSAQSIKQLSAQDFEDQLPASYRTRSQVLAVPVLDDVEFLKVEFDLQRLDKIFDLLGLAGRPMPPRALHYQLFLQRSIVVVQKLDLHLLWLKDRIFIKPIPLYLLDHRFWTTYLQCHENCVCSSSAAGKATKSQEICEQKRLRCIATGFLYSYCGLLVSEIDFRLAKQHLLVPEEMSWMRFKIVLQGIIGKPSLRHEIHRRFLFGELRLSRVNKIYRFSLLAPFRGYHLQYSSYGAFWKDNLHWLASLVVYVALALTAFQVGLATPLLATIPAFQSASYGFTIFSILGPLAIFLGFVVVFIFVLVNNLMKAISFYRQTFRTPYSD